MSERELWGKGSCLYFNFGTLTHNNEIRIMIQRLLAFCDALRTDISDATVPKTVEHRCIKYYIHASCADQWILGFDGSLAQKACTPAFMVFSHLRIKIFIFVLCNLLTQWINDWQVSLKLSAAALRKVPSSMTMPSCIPAPSMST